MRKTHTSNEDLKLIVPWVMYGESYKNIVRVVETRRRAMYNITG